MSCFLVTSKRRGPDGREGSGAQAQRGGTAAQGNPGRPLAGLAGASSDGGRERECRRDGPSTTTGRAGTRAGGKGKEAGVALACAGGFRNEHKKVSSDRWFNQEKQCNYVSKCRERKRWRAEESYSFLCASEKSKDVHTHALYNGRLNSSTT